MDAKQITGIVMIVGIVGWIAWDIVVAANGIPGDTISEITMGIAQAAPIIPLAVGVICGHLFGHFDFVYPVVAFLKARPLIPFLWGVLSGLFLWNQGK